MFRRMTQPDPPPRTRALTLFRRHPAELNALLDLAWDLRLHDASFDLGHPNHRSDLGALPRAYLNLFPTAALNINATAVRALQNTVRWDHLIYAYMIESTRIYEVFRRVLQHFLAGEQIGVPDPAPDVQLWLRNTEELFYRDPAPFSITSITSHIRPDLLATRRNAYYRMFGMDLIHGKGDSQTYPYEKPEAANTEFVAIFEEFLREVWVGITNFGNTSGENPTDNAAILTLVTRLHDMLRSRRLGGNLAREEFQAVSTMSWFHLTIEFNSPIVLALRAEATSPEERLRKIADRVNLPSPSRTKSFFELADPISALLILIELVDWTDAAVPALYSAAPMQSAIRTILTHWSLATGHDLKTRRAAPVAVRA